VALKRSVNTGVVGNACEHKHMSLSIEEKVELFQKFGKGTSMCFA
jgi:hypothetical protein